MRKKQYKHSQQNISPLMNMTAKHTTVHFFSTYLLKELEEDTL